VVDSDVQHIFMKSLFAVAEKHTATLFTSNFPIQLLYSLLRLLQTPDSDVRLLVVQTLHILADRHGNLEKLSVPTLSPGSLGLNGFPSKPNRADHIFVQKSVFKVYAGFKTVLMEQNNSKEFLDAVFATVALLSVETSGINESVHYLLDFVDAIQNIAIKEMALSTENRFALHAVAIALLALVALIVNVPEIDAYLESIIEARQQKAPHMLPPLHEEYNPGLDPNTPDEDVIIVVDTIKEALKSAGKDVQGMDSLPRLRTSSNGAKTSPRNSFLPHEPRPMITSSASLSRRPSTVSTLSGSHMEDIDSCSSSPHPIRRIYSEEVSTKALKNVLLTSSASKEYEDKQKKIKDVFLEGTFEDICAYLDTKPDYSSKVQNRLSFVYKNGHHNGEETDLTPTSEDADKTLKENYSVMKDNEPYMNFFPQFFMY